MIGFTFSIFPTKSGMKNINSAPSKTLKLLYRLNIVRVQSVNITVIKDRKTILLRIRNNSIPCNFNTSNYHSYINYTWFSRVDKWRILFAVSKIKFFFRMVAFTLKNLVERHFIYLSISSKISSIDSGVFIMSNVVEKTLSVSKQLFLIKWM